MPLPKEEIARKLLHLFALLMPAGIYYIPKYTGTWMIPPVILGALFIGSVIIEKMRQLSPGIQELFFKLFGSMLRKEETKQTTGSTWVIGAAFICSIIFRNEPQVALMVLTIFILGDAVAALVGMSIGKIKIGKKSLEGSLACFLLCMFFFYAVFPFIPGLLAPYGGRLPLMVALITSLTVTVFELVPLKITPKIIINDNLAVPVIAGLLLRLLMNKIIV
jgi:dolichol kinase